MAGLALVADIGGTNTRMALARGTTVDASTVRRFANAEVTGFAEVIRRYLSEAGIDGSAIDSACAAGAGPVHDGVIELTNLKWRVGEDVLRSTLGCDHAAVLNDLQAQGFAVGHTAPDHLTEITPQPAGEPMSQSKLVVGFGTGVNAAPVLETPAGRLVLPSECGHVSLPQGGDPRVYDALRARFGFASVEEALSGRGIGQVHAALHNVEATPAEVLGEAEAGEAAALETVAQVVKLMGAVIGDLALVFLPFGGIHLIGGVTRNMAPWFDRFGFTEAMRAKGRFEPFLQQFGVYVVTDDYAALVGCAAHLSESA